MSERECVTNRTHEPNLRELVSEIDGLREVLMARIHAAEKLAEERDGWYAERDRDRQTSIDKALTAQKEQTASSFAASKEAILKAEEAQRAYNTSHNDLARKMDEQNKATMPRIEIESRFSNMEEKINNLRESRSEEQGGKAGRLSAQQFVVMIVALIVGLITIGGVVVAIAYAIRP